MGVVDDFFSHLENESLAGAGTEWKLRRRRLTDEQHRMVVLTEDGGFEPETPSTNGIGSVAYAEPAFQVRVRGEPNKSDEAYDKAQSIMDALHGLQRVNINSNYYARVKAQSPEPLFIGFDEKSRPEFTQSFRAVIGVTAP